MLHPQSADIAQGVDALQPGTNKEEGAGDKGIMFGYPPRTPGFGAGTNLLRPQDSAADLGSPPRRQEKVLGPDSKSQVTVQYENGRPVGVREIVVSRQHLVET